MQVYVTFLDTLADVIATHRDEMLDFLHMMLSRLLLKLGTEPLPSVANRVQRVLDLIRFAHLHFACSLALFLLVAHALPLSQFSSIFFLSLLDRFLENYADLRINSSFSLIALTNDFLILSQENSLPSKSTLYHANPNSINKAETQILI